MSATSMQIESLVAQELKCLDDGRGLSLPDLGARPTAAGRRIKQGIHEQGKAKNDLSHPDSR
jgi:hypothetical protein